MVGWEKNHTNSTDFKTNFGLNARYEFFKRAQYYLQVNRIDGVYTEFGCHEVNTFRMSLNTLGAPRKPNKISKFYAFDSFEGMPEPEGIDNQRIWKKSMNFTSLKRFQAITKKDQKRIVAVKGFYDQTLPTFELGASEKIALAFIDCDYYSSTRDCLNFIKDYSQHGCLIAFDDWDCFYSDPLRGQKLAFMEFADNLTDYTFEPICDIPSGGKCFVAHEKSKVGKEIM